VVTLLQQNRTERYRERDRERQRGRHKERGRERKKHKEILSLTLTHFTHFVAIEEKLELDEEDTD